MKKFRQIIEDELRETKNEFEDQLRKLQQAIVDKITIHNIIY